LSNFSDRYHLNLFHQGKGSEIDYYFTQETDNKVFDCENLHISMLAMDFKEGQSRKYRKQLENHWIDLLPQLDKVKTLSIRHIVTQAFFEAICKMKNLERLFFWTSNVEDISNIKNLKKLKRLRLERFSRLSDISILLELKELRLLSVLNSFKIDNYELIGKMTDLIGLTIRGDETAPKNLRLASLKPFEGLTNLRHLDLSATSVIDKSYDSIVKMISLERFDITVGIDKLKRDLIKSKAKALKAGFFMAWDYENRKFYPHINW